MFENVPRQSVCMLSDVSQIFFLIENYAEKYTWDY